MAGRKSALPIAQKSLQILVSNARGHPIHCPEYPWYDWTFAETHTQIACDPAVWSGVEGLIRQQIAPASAKQD
jgi:hypothetical protein